MHLYKNLNTIWFTNYAHVNSALIWLYSHFKSIQITIIKIVDMYGFIWVCNYLTKIQFTPCLADIMQPQLVACKKTSVLFYSWLSTSSCFINPVTTLDCNVVYMTYDCNKRRAHCKMQARFIMMDYIYCSLIPISSFISP